MPLICSISFLAAASFYLKRIAERINKSLEKRMLTAASNLWTAVNGKYRPFSNFFCNRINASIGKQLMILKCQAYSSTCRSSQDLCSVNKHPCPSRWTRSTECLKKTRRVDLCLLHHRESREDLLRCNFSRFGRILEHLYAMNNFLEQKNIKTRSNYSNSSFKRDRIECISDI